MREWKSQSHVKWYCKYHIVFSYRKKAMFGSLRKGVGKILRELCNQSGVELVEGHAMSDHVHLCLSIPPKYSVANTVGFLSGYESIVNTWGGRGTSRGSIFGHAVTVFARWVSRSQSLSGPFSSCLHGIEEPPA